MVLAEAERLGLRTTGRLGAKNVGWLDNGVEDFLLALQCIPAETKGFAKFLKKAGDGVNQAKGAYAVARLFCQAPELAGRSLDNIADLVEESGKEGVDLITRTSTGVLELWEVKYVKNAMSAVSDAQIRKHIATRIATAYDAAVEKYGIKNLALIRDEMRRVKLRFDVVSPTASAQAKAALFEQVRSVLGEPAFRHLSEESAFLFEQSDIIMRKADPLFSQMRSWAEALPF